MKAGTVSSRGAPPSRAIRRAKSSSARRGLGRRCRAGAARRRRPAARCRGPAPPRPDGRAWPCRRRAAGAPMARRNGDVVERVHHEAQVRDDVLDLAPLVEAHAAHDQVRDARPPERVLEHARLGVGAVEDRHVAVVQRRRRAARGRSAPRSPPPRSRPRRGRPTRARPRRSPSRGACPSGRGCCAITVEAMSRMRLVER